MATAARSYRNSQISPRGISRALTNISTAATSLTSTQVATTLDELVDLGFIERFKDEHNITRYRPVAGNRQ